MSLVYVKISLELTECSNFWRKLRRFVGDFRIEQQDFFDIEYRRLTISFYTNKVNISEGDSRLVMLEAKSNIRGSWYFTKIEK